MEINQSVKTSSFGTLNATDWKSMAWTLLIQIAAAAVTAVISFLAYLGNQSELPQWLMIGIPVMQIVFTQLLKGLQKLLDGPTTKQAEQVARHQVPEGYERVTALEKIPKSDVA